MAAIWGVITKDKLIDTQKIADMRDSMKEFAIDRLGEEHWDNSYFACGHQYFTEEAVKDVSPIWDKERKLLFAADCYLLNRNEIIEELMDADTTTSEAYSAMGDAMLAYHAYLCWGESFVQWLKGSFAFAIYRIAEGELLLYTDHLAQRYLSYTYTAGEVCFSTLYQPLLAYMGKERIKLNREWITAAFTDCTADTLRIPRITVYEGIFHVEPGCYIKISVADGTAEKIAYWNPLTMKRKFHGYRDEDYKKHFLATFEQTLNSMLRARGETGISLSGGLDSSAVGDFAARKLAREGKKLYSYTSVPAKDFEYHNSRFVMENETDMVLEHQKMYPNIISKFIDVSDRNCFTNMEAYADIYHEPVKPVLNMTSLEEIRATARRDGCSILLSGQNGNATISYGNILTYLYQKCLSGHFVAAYREAKAFCRFRRVSSKKLVKVFMEAVKDEKFTPLTYGEDCFIRAEDIKRYHLLARERKIKKNRGTGFLDSRKQRKGFCFMPQVFQHMGFFDTYGSLKYGVLPLDPTLSKDMIELCMVLPIDCYVRGGKERRAVRDYMKGYVPDRILDNHLGRGRQAADFDYRVNRDWEEIKDKVYTILEEPELKEYLDTEKLQKLLEEVRANGGAMGKDMVAKLAVISSLGCFLKMVKNNNF